MTSESASVETVPKSVAALLANPDPKTGLHWTRNATDMVQVRGTPEQLVMIRDWFLSMGWIQGFANHFNVTLADPNDPQSLAGLTIYRHFDTLRSHGAPIPEKVGRVQER